MSFPLLTVHTLTALPWHNLNRDESGAPKQVTEGGVVRGRLSSQSLKRAARVGFEHAQEAADASVRTKLAVGLIVDRVAEIRGGITDAERTKLTRSIGIRVHSLTQNTTKSEDTVKKDTLVWLSATELEQVAQAFARGDDTDVVSASSTDSLPIAAFGRMFAAAPGLNVSAAVSVGDAVTTHAAIIELDWFAAVDDAVTSHNGAGQLGFTMQTTGVYYRSFTIDRVQLARNWDIAMHSDVAEPALRSLIRHLTFALPSGRGAGTAAQSLPAFVLAEEQSHRVAYNFQQPVTATDKGFLEPSIDALLSRAMEARAFDRGLFGRSFTTGTDASLADGDFTAYTDFVLDFLRDS